MSTEVTLAQAPFDDARADLILQSSGHEPVHFRVSKFILSVASPIFADMFNIPPPPASQSPHDEIQVVPVSEDSETLDLSLRHIYPIWSPTVTQLSQMRILAEFAHKYQVDALEQDVSRYLMDAIDGDPIGVYVIAVSYGYKSVGKRAAQRSLKLPFSRLQSPHVQHAPAELYGELLMYHASCGEVAGAVASERSWFSSLGNARKFIHTSPGRVGANVCKECITCDTLGVTQEQPHNARCVLGTGSSERGLISRTRPSVSKQHYGPRSLWNYLYRSVVVLARHPTADAINTEDFIFKEFNCANCSPNTRPDMLEVSRVFGTEIDKAVRKVGGLLVLWLRVGVV